MIAKSTNLAKTARGGEIPDFAAALKFFLGRQPFVVVNI